MTIYHAANLRRGRHFVPAQVYLVTAVTRCRAPLFREFSSARQVIRAMRALEREARLESLAFVVMPDHLHWLFSLKAHHELSEVMRLLKGRTARSLNMQRVARGEIWQAGYHDHALRNEEDIRDTARYLIANPLRAGLVNSVRDYPHWDATWL